MLVRSYIIGAGKLATEKVIVVVLVRASEKRREQGALILGFNISASSKIYPQIFL